MNALRWVLAGLVLAPSVATAQRDTLARLAGLAKSSFNGRPIAGVLVAVPAQRAFAVTDSTGVFDIAGLASGRHKVRIAYEGRDSEEFEFDLRGGKTKRLEIVLDVEAVDLAPIVVEGRATYWRRDLAGFYARKRWYGGSGRFFTQEDIERLRPTSLRALLARAGVLERCVGAGCLPSTSSRGRTCVLPVSVDGMPFWEHDYDMIPVEEVAAVEVYRNQFSVPADLSGLSLGYGYGSPRCGAIGIWTR